MLRKFSSVSTAAALLFVSSPSTRAGAAEPVAESDIPHDAPRDARVLRVEVAPGLDGADRIEQSIVAEGEAQLDIQRLEATLDPAAPKYIGVEVGGEDYDYSIRVTADRGPGQPVGAAIVTGCTCSETELVRAVLKEVAEAAQRFGARAVPAGADGNGGTAGPTEPPAPDASTRQPPRDGKTAPLGPAGWAGVGVAVVGAGLLIGGGVLYGRENVGGTQLEATRESFRPTAIPLLAAGGAGLLAGAALLIVDLTVLKRRRSGVALRPVLTRTAAGVSLHGSF